MTWWERTNTVGHDMVGQDHMVEHDVEGLDKEDQGIV